jgi:hypothetical protein
MIRHIGSQARERIEETDYLCEGFDPSCDSTILVDKATGQRELWFKNDHHAGYTIEIDGIGYEFAHSIQG